MRKYKNIRFSIQDHIARIELHRPETLNSLNAALLHEMRDAILATTAQQARVLMLTGAGRGFCSGADLGAAAEQFQSGQVPDLGKSLNNDYHPMLEALYALEIPVVNAVNGVAAGAGASIALAGDIVIAGRSALFQQAFVNIGLVPDAAGTWLLPRLAGRARALGLCMLGEAISATQAAEWGLIWQVVDDQDLMPSATGIAERLARQPPLALAAIKQALRAGPHNDLSTQLGLESRLQTRLGQSVDFIEGVSAFLEKRPAEFSGR